MATEPTDRDASKRNHTRSLLVAGTAVCLLLLVGIAVRELVVQSGATARRLQCLNQMKTIALGLEAYHAEHGTFPPAYTADADGRRMHSWRVLILPQIAKQMLRVMPRDAEAYRRRNAWLEALESYDFSQPWDSPANHGLLANMPPFYRCPDDPDRTGSFTSYCLITGPGTVFSGSTTMRRDDIPDDPARTLILVEVSDARIPWTAPRDIDLTAVSSLTDSQGPPSRHTGAINVAFADGHVETLETSLDAALLQALLRADDGLPDSGASNR